MTAGSLREFHDRLAKTFEWLKAEGIPGVILEEQIDYLLAEVERLRAAMLRMQEDGYPQVCCGYEEDGECLWCAAHPSPGGEGHEADCPWLVVESVKGEKR